MAITANLHRLVVALICYIIKQCIYVALYSVWGLLYTIPLCSILFEEAYLPHILPYPFLSFEWSVSQPATLVYRTVYRTVYCTVDLLQLQHLVADDNDIQAMEMFVEERKKGGTGGPISTAHQRSAAEQAYQRRAEQLMSEENCFKVVLVSAVTWQRNWKRRQLIKGIDHEEKLVKTVERNTEEQWNMNSLWYIYNLLIIPLSVVSW